MQERDCRACGGTKSIPDYSRGYYTHSGVWLPGQDRCPVCLGAGRISDVRTARDAMVDAEALRLVVDAVHTNTSYLPQARATAFTIRLWLIPAAEFGARAARYALEGWDAHGLAWDAARAAFRAVPGLREGE